MIALCHNPSLYFDQQQQQQQTNKHNMVFFVSPEDEASQPHAAAYRTLHAWRAQLTAENLAEWLPPPKTPFASNQAYRQCLRRVFTMDAAARTNFGDGAAVLDPSVEMDAETADELMFDTAQADAGLRDWFDLSENDPEFLCLYDWVGYTFVQLNPVVGISALMNFDDFAPFCRAVAAYLASIDMDPLTGRHRGGQKTKYAPELFALLDKFRPRDA